MSAHGSGPPWGVEPGEPGGPESEAGGPEPARHRPPPSLPVGLVLGFYGALVAGAWLWREWVDGVPPWRAPGAAPDALGGWPGHLLLGGVAGVALAYASRAWSTRTEAGTRLSQELGRLLGPVSGQKAVALALASGVAEEVFFRGALQPRVGLLVASALFGLAHWGPTPALRPWALYAALAGLGFGALFELSGSVLAPAAAHVTTNALNLRWLGRGEAES